MFGDIIIFYSHHLRTQIIPRHLPKTHTLINTRIVSFLSNPSSLIMRNEMKSISFFSFVFILRIIFCFSFCFLFHSTLTHSHTDRPTYKQMNTFKIYWCYLNGRESEKLKYKIINKWEKETKSNLFILVRHLNEDKIKQKLRSQILDTHTHTKNRVKTTSKIEENRTKAENVSNKKKTTPRMSEYVLTK